MDNQQPPRGNDIADEIEQAIEDKHDGVLAADATGMVGNEELIRVVELRKGEVTPPA
jgi:hypothetical protein